MKTGIKDARQPLTGKTFDKNLEIAINILEVCFSNVTGEGIRITGIAVGNRGSKKYERIGKGNCLAFKEIFSGDCIV